MTPQPVDSTQDTSLPDAAAHTHAINTDALRVRYGALPLVLSVQSQMAIGHVGNSMSVPVLQLLECQVAAVPTALVSNHAGHPTMRGRMLEGELLADLFLGLAERGVLQHLDFVLSGYLGSAEAGLELAAVVDRAREVNPGLRYVCDPVMGDLPQGFFVPEPVRAVLLQELLGRADVLTPNLFELRAITGQPAVDEAGVVAAASALAGEYDLDVVVTGVRLDSTAAGEIETFTVQRTGEVSRAAAAYIPVAPIGTGDFFAALVCGQLAYQKSLPDAVALAVRTVSAALSEVHSQELGEITLTRPILRSILAAGPAQPGVTTG